MRHNEISFVDKDAFEPLAKLKLMSVFLILKKN